MRSGRSLHGRRSVQGGRDGHRRRSGHRDHRGHRGRRRRRREGLARLIDELELRARRRRRRWCRHGMHFCGTRRRRRNHDHRWSHRRRRRRLGRRAGMLGRRRRRRRARGRGLVVQRLDGHPRQDPPALLERSLHEVVDDVLLDDHRPRGRRDGRVHRRLGSERHDDVARRGRRYGAVVTRRGHARRDHSAADRAPFIPDARNGRHSDHPLIRRDFRRGEWPRERPWKLRGGVRTIQRCLSPSARHWIFPVSQIPRSIPCSRRRRRAAEARSHGPIATTAMMPPTSETQGEASA